MNTKSYSLLLRQKKLSIGTQISKRLKPLMTLGEAGKIVGINAGCAHKLEKMALYKLSVLLKDYDAI